MFIPQSCKYTSLTLFCVGILSIFLLKPQTVAAQADLCNCEEVVGVVISAPATVDGYGEWQLRTDEGDILTMSMVQGESYFVTAIPVRNDVVLATLEFTTPDHGKIGVMMRIDEETTALPNGNQSITHIVLQGSVVEKPTVPDGTGLWKVYSDGSIYDIDVYDKAAFTRGMPEAQNDIFVHGWAMAAKTISAETFELNDGTLHYEPAQQLITNLSGQVIGTPADIENGQLWRIRHQTTIYIVQTNDETAYDPMPPQPNTFVDLLVVTEDDDTPPIVINMSINTFAIGEVIVRVQPGADITTIGAPYGLMDAAPILQERNIYRLSSRNPTIGYLTHVIEKLKLEPAVLWAELNYVSDLPIGGHPHRVWGWGGQDDTSYLNQSAFQQVNLADVPETYRGNGQVVAILDTGVDLQHPALKDLLAPGIDFVDNDTEPDDRTPGMAQGHGTHISGIVARIAPDSQILPVRVLDADGRGDLFAVTEGIEWAVNHHADVINLSLGTAEDSQMFHDTIHWATEKGVTIVAAAGNDNAEELQFPAAYTETIAVTAVDSQLVKADFANYGDWIDLAAPGVGITSTMVSAQGSGYAAWSGTSMSTPFVSGAAAILHEKYPHWTALQIKQRLVDRGEQILAQDNRYLNLLGKFLNIKQSIYEDKQYGVYMPLIVATNPPFLWDGPR